MSEDYFDQSNNLINEFLKQTISVINEEWDDISVNVRFADGFVESKAFFLKGGVKKSILITKNAQEILSKLKELNSSPEKGSLKGLTFKVSSSGKFDVNYEY